MATKPPKVEEGGFGNPLPTVTPSEVTATPETSAVTVNPAAVALNAIALFRQSTIVLQSVTIHPDAQAEGMFRMTTTLANRAAAGADALLSDPSILASLQLSNSDGFRNAISELHATLGSILGQIA